jgi:hypothetical protein
MDNFCHPVISFFEIQLYLTTYHKVFHGSAACINLFWWCKFYCLIVY